MSIISTPPRPNTPDVTDARADGSGSFTQTGSFTFSAASMDLGTVIKGVLRSVLWLTFEIPFPVGTRFGAMSINLKRGITLGSDDFSVWVGFLATDGTWNTGGESGLGWKEYLNIEDLPHPNSSTGPEWLNSSISLSHIISISDHSDGNIVKWGTNVTGLNYENHKFLTDLQTAFDENEPNRTSRGVPVAIAMVPHGTTSRIFRFETVEGTTAPQLFIRTRRVITI